MPQKPHPRPLQGGSYILHLNIKKTLTLQVGSLGDVNLPSGHCVYIGSARKSISGRVTRHKRLADTKTGKLHWHIDYVLIHPEVELIRADDYAGREECTIARQVELMQGASTPVLRFGASDCRSGCKAHFFRVGKSGKGRSSFSAISKATQKTKNS